MSTAELPRTCQATRYAKGDCEGLPRFDVVYHSRAGAAISDQHPACFSHGLAEVNRHYQSGGIATCEIVEHRDDT